MNHFSASQKNLKKKIFPDSFYFHLSDYFRQEFGEPVRKVSIDAGFTCPNQGHCIYCDSASFSPSRQPSFARLSIEEQIRTAVEQYQTRTKIRKFIAYFQPSTNTNGSPEHLEQIYRKALTHPQIVGIAIGTRPDCLADPILDLLQKLSEETWLSLEIGLQTIHNHSLSYLNRGHDFSSFDDAVCRAQKRNLRLGTHIILGIPGETHSEMMQTADKVAQYHLHSLKLHNLYVVRGTKLAEYWQAGLVSLPTLEEYAELAVDFIERQPPETVIERIASDAAEEYLLAPDWTGKRHAARNAIDAEFRRRFLNNTQQK